MLSLKKHVLIFKFFNFWMIDFVFNAREIIEVGAVNEWVRDGERVLGPGVHPAVLPSRASLQPWKTAGCVISSYTSDGKFDI